VSALTLSRVLLSLRGDRGPRGSTREYLLHQLVADLFPDRPDRGYLFRETRPRPCGAELLVLSEAPPRPPEEVPVQPWGCAVDVRSKPFTPRLSAGMVLDFEARVNATREVTALDGTKKRVEIWNAVFAGDHNDPRTPHDVYREWLARKLEGAAEVDQARITERGEVRVGRGTGGGRHPMDRRILFVAANVIGALRVVNPDLLIQQIAGGIGRAKAFGCGLLCLSRPGTVLRRRDAGVLES
jgi:CRISPR system Cascade subunit CasE